MNTNVINVKLGVSGLIVSEAKNINPHIKRLYIADVILDCECGSPIQSDGDIFVTCKNCKREWEVVLRERIQG